MLMHTSVYPWYRCWTFGQQLLFSCDLLGVEVYSWLPGHVGSVKNEGIEFREECFDLPNAKPPLKPFLDMTLKA